jgi:hypothetical protein
MCYPSDDHFSKQMRASGGPDPDVYGANLETQFKTGWYNIWSRMLADNCLPPADERIEIRGQPLDIHYNYIPTIRDIPKPQIGLINDAHLPWLHTSITLSDAAKSSLAERELGFGQAEARNRIFQHIENKQVPRTLVGVMPSGMTSNWSSSFRSKERLFNAPIACAKTDGSRLFARGSWSVRILNAGR